MKKYISVMFLVVVLMLMTGVGQAAPIQGALWEPADAYAKNPASGPPEGPFAGIYATFTVDSLDFYSMEAGAVTYDNWLSGGSGNPNGLVWVNDDGGIKDDLFYTSPEKGTYFQFSGTAFFPANTLITHDDGFWLKLGDTVYGEFSGPVYVKNDYLGNPEDIYEFTLKYGAWNGFPEVLQAHGVTTVPEPTSMLLLGLGLVGLAGMSRRFKR